ncbi:histidinol dehydrogenase [Vulcanibacillus modesticaldus]|uniref:Histidinol dehydrogenase n=1 Tax=Vulcanibacillus modesticaldus TaxID=337097 RepID=A0A1D2YV27_9BACI|nr:histidinol dehydrogenase [Vulcanibacillus modesticaldus]OEF99564.1 histidinol dehydrogenase [Vulcanibacillus modesticaldus]
MINVTETKTDMDVINKIMSRNQIEFEEINRIVEEILANVKKNRDDALRDYTLKFDRVEIENFLVSQAEIDEAFNNIDQGLKEALLNAKKNIEKYHEKQLIQSYYLKEGKDIILGRLVNPIEKVGIYVPGGSAAYPSTVLMNAIPAKIAGVEEIIMITPPGKDGKIKDSILVAAAIAGVDKIFKVGGAQGIGALAFGTESIPKVSKIVGPGNIYVAMAKKRVSGYVGIDMIAGPSEILIIADEMANAKFIAADLISQAEHDEMAASILLTDSRNLAEKVVEELAKQVEKLERKEIINKSLNNYGAIIITSNLEESIEIANQIAPEHLEILTEDPFAVVEKIKNAGAIFLGEFSPEPVGDYFAGPNHTLPTSSTAKFSSPLGVDDFLKKTSLIYYSKEALKGIKESVIQIANDEGLTAHANSVKIRFEEEV